MALEYEIRFRCKDLLKRDGLSKSDPFVEVLDSYKNQLGVTETILNEQDPIFVTPIIIDKRRLPIMFRVFDRDSNRSDSFQGNDFLGETDFIEEEQLRNAKDQLVLNLGGVKLKKGEHSAGSMLLHAEVFHPNSLVVSVKLSVSMPAPFGYVCFDVYRSTPNSGWLRIIRDPVPAKVTNEKTAEGTMVDSYLALQLPFSALNIAKGEDRSYRIVISSLKKMPPTTIKSHAIADKREVHAVFESISKQLLVGNSKAIELTPVPFSELKEIGLLDPDYTSHAKKDVSITVLETFMMK